jgi:cellulose biosynthesis protein BcsQ
MKGGVGKTTVTLGLASAAWKRNWRTLVIDLDPQANATIGLGVDEPGFTISDVLADSGPGIASEAITSTTWGDHVSVLASEASLENRSQSTGANSVQRLRIALASIPRQHDIVLIDCPPSLGEMTRNALHVANIALVVTEPGFFALRGAQQALEAIDAIRRTTNPALARSLVVVNRARMTVAEHRHRVQELEEFYGSLVSPTRIPERNAIPQSEAAGMPIHAWESPAGTELANMFDVLLDDLVPGGSRG